MGRNITDQMIDAQAKKLAELRARKRSQDAAELTQFGRRFAALFVDRETAKNELTRAEETHAEGRAVSLSAADPELADFGRRFVALYGDSRDRVRQLLANEEAKREDGGQQC